MSTPPLVLAVHGTRNPAGGRTSRQLADAVRAELPGTEVHLGWVDIHTPPLAELLAEVGEAVVVPVFLTSGYHVTSDIPAALAKAGSRARAGVLVGGSVLPAVADRLAQAGEADAVVLAAAGSLRPRAIAQVRAAAARLARMIGREVAVGFVTAATPSVADAVAGLRAAGHRRVAIASYLLAPGLFQDSLHRAGADIVAAPIGVHPLLIEAIRQRYHQVLDDIVGDAAPGVAVND